MNDIAERLRNGEDGLELAAADEIDRLNAEINILLTELEQRHTTSEFWKENHLAGNAEIERLDKYRALVWFIANDYYELSYDKIKWQRDDWKKRCQKLIEELEK